MDAHVVLPLRQQRWIREGVLVAEGRKGSCREEINDRLKDALVGAVAVATPIDGMTAAMFGGWHRGSDR